MRENQIKFKITIIGTGDPGRPPVLSGCLKTYLDSIDELKNKIETQFLAIESWSDVNPKIYANSNMIVLSPHEDRDNKEMFDICKKIKADQPNTYIVLCAENLRNRIRPQSIPPGKVDFLIHGESEAALAELTSAIINKTPIDKVRGIISFDRGKIKIHKPLPPIKNLDNIPSPYLAGLFNLKNYESLELLTQRGCKYNCKYCTINEGGARYFSPQRIEKELEVILKEATHLKEISIMGFDMFAEPIWSQAVLKLFHKVADKKKIKFVFDVNVNSLNNIDLLKLSNTPQFHMEIGVQSINPEVLKAAGRPSDIETLKSNIGLIKKYSPKANVYISIIRGLPEDTLDGYKKTLDWVISTGYYVVVNHLRIMPETSFDKITSQQKINISKEYPYFALATADMPKSDMQKAISITEEAGFILKLMEQSKKFKKVFFNLAEDMSKNSSLPFLNTALNFYRHLAQTNSFGEMVRTYTLNRESQKCLDWQSDYLEFIKAENINENLLLKEFSSFSRKYQKKISNKDLVLSTV